MNARDQAHAVILLRVAVRTVAEARDAWRSAEDENSLRTAYRTCVLAARASQRAVDAWADDARVSGRLAVHVKRLNSATIEIRTRLVRALVGAS